MFVQVEVPRVQPKLSEPFLGFTQTAEIWNSRACMIGLIGTFIVELVMKEIHYMSTLLSTLPYRHVMFGSECLLLLQSLKVGFLIFRC